jgi:hypothetical protein
MATKSRSKHQEGLYKAYQAQNRQAANRKRKLTKLAKQFPNNEQITLALKNISYRRGTPKTSMWSHTSKAWAQMKKEFSKPGHGSQRKVSEKEMFKLRARAHDAEGNLIWNS